MLLTLSSLLFGAALAGPVVGLGLGADLPLEAVTASSVGPAVSLQGGWAIDRGALEIQPELVVRLSAASGTVVPAIGCALAWGEVWRVGAYAHAGVSVPGGLPAADAGLLGQRALGRASSLFLRGGYALAQAYVINHCIDCPQPADHWAAVALGLSWRG